MSGTQQQATGIFCPRRLAHANLFVSDLEAAQRFWTRTAGLTKVFDEPGIGAVFLSNGATHHDVALMEVSDKPRIGIGGHVQVSSERGSRPGLNHLGFEMESEADLVAAYRRCQEAGVELHRTTDHKISRSIYLFDPDGNYVEFYADATDDWRETYRRNEGSLISEHWDPLAQDPARSPRYQEDPDIEAPEDAVFRPRRLVHAVLVVSDLERLLTFYTQVAGMRLVHDHRDDGYAVLAGAKGGVDLALFSATEGQPPGLHHLGFEVADADELSASIRRAREQLGDDAVDDLGTGAAAAVIRDPDGIACKFFARRPDDGAPAPAPFLL
ncbi:MAG TPA: VOC family protein [Solirubrobacteraceae bacterium]|nr:VOC family protein [Solirubrobacteraceae bacterium]